MRPIRKVISVEVNNEVYGFFANFKIAYKTLMSDKFSLKSYENEIKKFRRLKGLKLLAVQRGDYYYTVNIKKVELNYSMMVMRPIFDN